MTIRLRLACLFTAVTFALLAGGGILFVTQLESGLEATLDTSLAARAAGISTQAASLPRDGSASDSRRSMPLTSANGITAELIKHDGTILRESRAVGPSPLIRPSQIAAATRHPLIFDATVYLREGSDSGPEPMRLLARSTGRSGNVVVVAISRDVVDRAVSRAAHQLVVLGLVVLLLVGPGSWLLTRAALRPVERMRRAVSHLQAHDADATLPVPKTRDEIARLAQTFNALLARLHNAVARERAFVGDAGHELRTPLTILKGEIELGRRAGRSREELCETLEVVAGETDRLVRLTEDMLFLTVQADSGTVDDETYDLIAIARSAVQTVASTARARKVDIIVDASGCVPASGNSSRIRRAIENLLTNAIRFSPPGGSVNVSVADDGPDLVVRVTDDGPGFPAEFLDHAFDRFARADLARSRPVGYSDELGGSGLGLAIVRAIMIRDRGTAVADNGPTGGACVTLRWPRRLHAEPAS